MTGLPCEDAGHYEQKPHRNRLHSRPLRLHGSRHGSRHHRVQRIPRSAGLPPCAGGCRARHRENILRALRRQQPERVGFDFVFSPALLEEFRRRTGREDYQEYYQFPVRFLELHPTCLQTDFTGFYDDLPPGTRPLDWNPEWGVMGSPGAVAHFQEMLHPMVRFTDVRQVRDYPRPDFLADYRWEGAAQKAREIKAQDLVCAAFMEMTIFEVAWYLRGMEDFMMDLMGGEEIAFALLDILTEMRVGMPRRYAEAGVDLLMLGDDVATQLNMMISPELWRETLKPRLAQVIRAAKEARPEILIFYHGDGNMEEILPDLVEIGVEVLNPVLSSAGTNPTP